MKTLLLTLLCLCGLTANAQEIQLTHQVIASAPIDADAYSWTVLVNGLPRPQADADQKTVIVPLHDAIDGFFVDDDGLMREGG